MQELIEWINLSKEDSKANGDTLTVHLDDLKEFADVLLEKEKEVMYDAWLVAISNFRNDTFFEEYYNETFKTK